MDSLFWRHAPAFFFALLVTLIIELPVFLFPLMAGSQYHGVNIAHLDTDQHFYLARAHDVLEGNGLGSSVIAGDKSQQDASFNNIEIVLMAPVRAFHLDRFFTVPTIYNVYNGLIVFGIVCAIYALLFAISEDRLIAVTGAVSLVAGLTALIDRSPFSGALHLYDRMPYPCAEVLVFFGFAYFVYRAITREAWLASAAVGAGLFAFSCYLSPYSWTFSFAFGGTLFLALLAAQKFFEAWRLFIIGAAGLVFGLPPLVSFVLFKISPQWAQQAYFYTETVSRAPFIPSIGILAVFLFVFYVYRWGEGESRVRLVFLASLILAGLLITNQQVISGWTASVEHYYRYFLLPTAVVACVYMFFKFIPQQFRIAFSAVVLAGVLLSLSINQYSAFRRTFPEALREQEYAAVVGLLNSRPSGGVLTMLDENVHPEPMLVPVLTDDDLVWSKTALFQTVPFQRIEDTFLFYLYLDAGARRDPIAYLEKSVIPGPLTPMQYFFRAIEGVRSGLSYTEYEAEFASNDSTLLRTREAFFAELAARYHKLFPDDVAARTWLVTQGTRYVLWDEKSSPEWDISFLKPYARITEQDGLSLFELR